MSADPRLTQIAEALIGVALRTELGQAYWNGYLIGAGLPKGGGALTVLAATYAPDAGHREPGLYSPRGDGLDGVDGHASRESPVGAGA